MNRPFDFIRLGDRHVKIEVHRISLQPVVANRVTAHDEEWNAGFVESVRDFKKAIG